MDSALPLTTALAVDPDSDLASELEAERPRSGASRRSLILGWSAVVAAVGLIAVAVFGLRAANENFLAIDIDVVGTEILSDRQITVGGQITADPTRAVSCQVVAQSAQKAVVGFVVVELPASEHPTRSFRVAVTTTEQAVIGLIPSCWLA